MKWLDYLSSNLIIKCITVIILSIIKKRYCGHPKFPDRNDQFKKAVNLILSHFQEKDHTFIHDTPKNKNTQLVSLNILFTDLRKTHPERI